MKKNILIFLFILVFAPCLLAQNTTEKVFSLHFKETPLKTAIEEIEHVSLYQFYFEENWISSNTNLITATFEKNSVEEVLEKILEKLLFLSVFCS